MPLLLVPLGLVALLALWLLLMPLALWQRYRRGHARRRALPWAVRFNAWSLLVSALMLLASAAVIGAWIDAALRHTALGLLAGIATGIVGLWATRFERGPAGLFYTPNRGLALALTLVVAARVAFGLVHLLSSWRGGATTDWIARQGGLLAVGGLLLGYHLGYAWMLRRRLAGPGY